MKTIPATENAVRAGLHADGAAVPLLGVSVQAELVAGHARARVRQRYQNTSARPIEAIYTFPLPSKAALTAFSMTVAGRRLDGEVLERDDAFRRYDDAITAGHGAALLEQERPNVFTSNVGNLLPGEETILEIEYVEPLTADEGAVRFCLPTVVAPRYMPGAPAGDRSGHGSADPTDRVPDADRISPPIGNVAYGLTLELVVDLGQDVEVESPSHAIQWRREGNKTIATFAQREVSLDRDVVVTAYAEGASPANDAAPLASVVAHRAGGVGTFALTIVPDLAGSLAKRNVRSEVVFVLDRSGSMGGASIEEARTALRLCLRQLREGDTFGIIAFDDQIELFEPRMVPFTQATLKRADDWLARVDARGGTEMLEPLVRAVDMAPDGVVVLLTDGQVGNEDEIQRAVVQRRKSARVYSFGIGTNVSDTLLHALAEKTGGAVESIHPGERVDEKVVAQFARATALRVTGIKIGFEGVEAGEIAPAEPAALVDGEPLTVLGTYEASGRGKVTVRGTMGGEAFYLEVPIDLPDAADRPVVPKLWARARIRDLEHAVVEGRRAETMKDRIVKLSKDHGVVSRYTSFVVVEKRTGERRATSLPETRVVPVAAPAGWGTVNAKRAAPSGARSISRPAAMPASVVLRSPSMPMGAPPPPRAAMPPSAPAPIASRAMMDRFEDADDDMSIVAASRSAATGGPPGMGRRMEAQAAPPADPIIAILEGQQASGLWEVPGKTILEATVDALLALVRHGVTGAHPVHGAQAKKAAEALLDLASASPQAEPRLLELALGLAWLVASGRRTRHAIEALVQKLPALATLRAALTTEADARAHVERLAC